MKKFKYIYIEITNICNLACKFCPKTNRQQEFMNINTFSHILDEIRPYTDYIYLHVKGEPLLHPNLYSILDIAYTKGFKINLTTNGFLINKHKDQLLNKPAIRQINISLHSISGNELSNYSKYLKDIISFSKEISSKAFVSLRLWNLHKHFIQNNDLILKNIEQEFDLPYKIKDKISNKGIKLRKNIYLNQDYEFKWPSLDEKELGETGFCYGLRTHLGILVDGTVIPCCLDGEGIINLGNINHQSFKEVINSKRALNIYTGFSKNQAVEELCRKCSYRKKFK